MPDGAEDQPGHQRSAGETELEDDPPRQRDRHDAEQQPERQPEAEGQDVHLAHRTIGIAEQLRYRHEIVMMGQDPDPVPKFQCHVAAREEIVVAAPDPGDDGSELLAQVQLAQTPPRYLGVGHEDAPEIELASVQVDLLLAFLPQVSRDTLYILGRPHHRDQIVDSEPFLRGRQLELPGTLHAAEDDIPSLFLAHLVQRFRAADVPPGDANGAILERLRGRPEGPQLLRLPGKVDAPDPLREGYGEDRPDHPHRVGDRVADDRLSQELLQTRARVVVFQGVENRRQGWRAGEAAGKHPCRDRPLQVQQLCDPSRQGGAKPKDAEHQQVIAQPLPLQ